ncbi:hypothetical protein AWB78_07084 [Caballeronia calidae]|uniref:Uncharacterized protein n=1 Tax=Caballeronia calidae TaxID=1777139 RepID=A0A158ECT6_9BURK|nr:hypothetical protein AWB78_07084 [Caballeronia calidae]
MAVRLPYRDRGSSCLFPGGTVIDGLLPCVNSEEPPARGEDKCKTSLPAAIFEGAAMRAAQASAQAAASKKATPKPSYTR